MHVHINKVQEPIDGFFDSFSPDGLANVKVLFALTSDDPAFYKLIGGISNTYFASEECSVNVGSIHSSEPTPQRPQSNRLWYKESAIVCLL